MGGTAKSVPEWRLAEALDQLRDQINAAAPHRARGWDGSIGDTAHSARKSDHNPDDRGVVRAVDITHDPANGCDAGAIAESLRLARDPRIAYVIWNRRIFSAVVKPWTWRHYTGENPHDHHVHVSVTFKGEDDRSTWTVSLKGDKGK